MDSFPIVGPARPEDLPSAFRLLFQTVAQDERDSRVANVLRLVKKGEINPEGVLVARGENGILGILVCQIVPGASGLVWPPQIIEGIDPIHLEDELLAQAVAWLSGNGAKLGQALLAPDQVFMARSLERNAFNHIASLCYLRHDLDLPVSLLLAEERLRYQSYRRANSKVFHETLLRTYQGTQDCPEVNGLRTIEEVIAGHRAQGKYDPGRWWLAFHANQPVGVVLLVELVESQSWELAYVGVVPDSRGRGFGREMVRKALFEARAVETGPLSLTVDSRNKPAWSLYQSLGFELYDSREVYLAIWAEAHHG